nr:MFS transporter [Planctomycetales bacterium]
MANGAAEKPLSFVERLLAVQPGERRALAWSFVYFFTLLFSYYILRPVREEMAIQGGTENIPWLFLATFIAMLAAVPIFGWLTSRYSRAQFLPWVYLFFAANLLLFFAAFRLLPNDNWTARIFFVWLSVFNQFVVSVFWAFMADLYNREQARRLFGMIAAGG